jgi:hypothetical protein
MRRPAVLACLSHASYALTAVMCSWRLLCYCVGVLCVVAGMCLAERKDNGAWAAVSRWQEGLLVQLLWCVAGLLLPWPSGSMGAKGGSPSCAASSMWEPFSSPEDCRMSWAVALDYRTAPSALSCSLSSHTSPSGAQPTALGSCGPCVVV